MELENSRFFVAIVCLSNYWMQLICDREPCRYILVHYFEESRDSPLNCSDCPVAGAGLTTSDQFAPHRDNCHGVLRDLQVVEGMREMDSLLQIEGKMAVDDHSMSTEHGDSTKESGRILQVSYPVGVRTRFTFCLRRHCREATTCSSNTTSTLMPTTTTAGSI